MVWDPDGAHDHKDEGVHVRGLGNCCEQAAVAVVQMKRQGQGCEDGSGGHLT